MSQPVLTIDTDRRSRLRLSEQLEVLSMSPRRRRRFLKKIGSSTIRDTRQNARAQRTITGSRMEPRASKKKRRMFRAMAKGMNTRIKNDHSADVTWKNQGQAKTAYRHHHGVPENFTASRAKKQYGVPDYKGKATPAQAKALNKEGFRLRVARKRGQGGAILKKVSQKWIRDNLTIGKAGLILRLMRTESPHGKQSWKIKVPARPILGATPEDADKYLTAMAANALQEIKRA
ncbi:MAG: hypothetical protein WBB23_07005 [Desulforhopalus sp.]